ncbi:MAG: ribonuclease P protein component [Eubacteriales bacterium]|nr:ribonuclease P protein component [Eubacteriales bacterium]
MKNGESLKKNRDFQFVYKNGTSYANKYLVMYVLRNQQTKNRLGISVSKKVGNSVVRHRITRLVRESYRLNEELFQLGYDIVVVARVAASSIGYWETERALLHLAARHHIKVEIENHDKKSDD